jgi:hypothetical protein
MALGFSIRIGGRDDHDNLPACAERHRDQLAFMPGEKRLCGRPHFASSTEAFLIFGQHLVTPRTPRHEFVLSKIREVHVLSPIEVIYLNPVELCARSTGDTLGNRAGSRV